MNRMRHPALQRACASLALPLVLGALAGCATPGPDRAQASLASAADAGLRPDPAPVPPRGGWALWGDAPLNDLLARALQGNPSLATARARAAQALAATSAQTAASQPQVALGVDASRQRYTAHGLVPAPVAGHVYDSGNIQVGLSWSPDWWGQHTAEEAAALGQARAAQADAAQAASLLATQVARGYVALARLVEQQALLDEMQRQRDQARALVAQRVAAGLDTQTELQLAQAPVPELAQQRAVLSEQMAVLRHQLAALTAQPVQALATLSPRLDGLHLDDVPAHLGADLLGRRPDVVAARWRVEAAAQDVNVARAQFYPDVRLSAFVGLNALGLGRVLKAGSEQAGVAPALRLPIFDAGLLRARLAGRQAAVDAAVAQYNAAVFDAAREAADALAAQQGVAEQREQQARQMAHVAHTLALAEQRQRAGLTGLAPVLNARLQLLQQHRQAIDLQARALDSRVLLFKALGGDWSPSSSNPPIALAP